MDDDKREMRKRSIAKFWRALLRNVPFFPVPDLYVLFQDLQKTQTDLDDQVEEAIDALQKSTELVAKLERSLKERTEKLALIRADYKRYSDLAKIEAENASALIEQLEKTIGSGKSRERWIAFAINLIAGLIIFFTGVVLHDPVRRLFSFIATTLFGIGSDAG